MSSECIIRRATPEDAARLGEIHVFGWRMAYRGLVSDEILFGKLRVVKRAEAFRKVLEEGSEETYVAESEGILRGFMTIGDCRDPDKGPDAFELWGIYVDPCFLRGGYGSRLLQFCEAEARSRGRSELLLWVFEENPRARAFYEKQGLCPDGKRQLIEGLGAYEVRYAKHLVGTIAGERARP
jgi:ribosomal protein S18 acetylase RimI-like enzyme